MELYEKTIESKEVYKGKIFTLKKDVVELPGGKTTQRDVVSHHGGVGVIAMTSDGKIPMVRQYRKGIEMVSLEIPAGKLEKDEDPLECGIRELREETGFSAKDFSFITKIAPTPAYCSEIIYIYEAKELVEKEQKLDEDEFLNVEYYTLDQLYNMILSGEIIDAKTIVAVMYLYKKEK